MDLAGQLLQEHSFINAVLHSRTMPWPKHMAAEVHEFKNPFISEKGNIQDVPPRRVRMLEMAIGWTHHPRHIFPSVNASAIPPKSVGDEPGGNAG